MPTYYKGIFLIMGIARYASMTEELTPGRWTYNTHLTILSEYITDSSCKGFDSKDSPCSSAIRSIIDASCISYGPVSEIVYSIAKEPLFLGSFHHAAFEIRYDTLRKESEDMYMHRTT
jgi:hypothetical protein